MAAGQRIDGGTHAFNALGEAVQGVVPGVNAPVPVPLGGGWAVLDAVVAAQPGEGVPGHGVQADGRDCAARMLAAAVLCVAVPCRKHYRGTHVAIGVLLNTSTNRDGGEDGELEDMDEAGSDDGDEEEQEA